MRETATKAAFAFAAVLLVVLAAAALAPLVTGGSSGEADSPQIADLDHEQYDPDRYTLADTPGQASVEMDSRETNKTVLVHVGSGVLERDVRPLVNVLTANGHDVEIIGDTGTGAGFPGEGPAPQPGFGEEQSPDVAAELEDAHAFVSVGADEYEPEEIEAIEAFADDGGRTLLLAEPQQSFTPGADTAELQSSLGVWADPGYVYNLADNDRNYQRVFVEPQGPGALTEGVDRVVFEAATPVDSADGVELLSVTDGTQLSTTRAETDAAVMVRADNVVFAGDTDFMNPENSLRADNDALVGNLADFLVTGDRSLEESDSGNDGSGTVETVTVGPGGDPVFEPQVLEIEPGTTVRFEWASSGYNLAVVFQPEGASWAGVPEVREEGFVHEHTFETEGVYEFVSEPQQAQGMSGGIVVGDPSESSGP